jgi:hypothetical protein
VRFTLLTEETAHVAPRCSQSESARAMSSSRVVERTRDAEPGLVNLAWFAQLQAQYRARSTTAAPDVVGGAVQRVSATRKPN